MNKFKWASAFFAVVNIILILSAVSACASMVELHYKVVDSELVPYVNQYNMLLTKFCPEKKYNTDLNYIIEIVDHDLDNPMWAGVCYRKAIGYKIQIRKSDWDRYDETLRQQIIDHEMAHCLIYKEHSKDPNNYMYFQLMIMDHDQYTRQAISDIKDFCSK